MSKFDPTVLPRFEDSKPLIQERIRIIFYRAYHFNRVMRMYVQLKRRIKLRSLKRQKSWPVSAIDAHVLIVCTYYEQANWIRETINSVKAQTFKNWTMVVIDDSSSSAPLKSLESEFEWGERVLLTETETNSGAYIARNKAIEFASSKGVAWTHITFIDSDDIASATWLEKALSILGNSKGAVRILIQRFLEPSKEPLSEIIWSSNPSMWDRATWDCLGGFCETPVAGDSELLNRAQFVGVNIKLSPDVGQYCRLHNNNASNSFKYQRINWLNQCARRYEKVFGGKTDGRPCA